MLIALDYDETYTRDKAFWDLFLVSARRYGHQVVCVTMRPDVAMEAVRKDLGEFITIYNTSGRGKDQFMKALGIKVDVWIDDQPIMVCFNKEEIPGFDHSLYAKHLVGEDVEQYKLI